MKSFPKKASSFRIQATRRLFQKGDRVWTYYTGQGAYAEYGVFPEQNTWRLPASISFPQGAGVGIPYFTAYRSLFQT